MCLYACRIAELPVFWVRGTILLSCAVDARSHVLETVQVWSIVAVSVWDRYLTEGGTSSLTDIAQSVLRKLIEIFG